MAEKAGAISATGSSRARRKARFDPYVEEFHAITGPEGGGEEPEEAYRERKSSKKMAKGEKKKRAKRSEVRELVKPSAIWEIEGA